MKHDPKKYNINNPTWPTTWFVPNLTGNDPIRDVYTVIVNWGANHGAISYDHIGTDLITRKAGKAPAL